MPPKSVLSPKGAPRGAPATRRYRRPLNEDAYSVDRVRERHAERKEKALPPSSRKAEDKYSSHAVRSPPFGSKDHKARPKAKALRESDRPTGASSAAAPVPTGASAAAPVPEHEAVRRLLPLMQKAAHEFAACAPNAATDQSDQQLWREFLSWAAVTSGLHPAPASASAPKPKPKPEPKPKDAPSSSSDDAEEVVRARITFPASGDGCKVRLTIGEQRQPTRQEV